MMRLSEQSSELVSIVREANRKKTLIFSVSHIFQVLPDLHISDCSGPDIHPPPLFVHTFNIAIVHRTVA
jgi:hypothetical protein